MSRRRFARLVAVTAAFVVAAAIEIGSAGLKTGCSISISESAAPLAAPRRIVSLVPAVTEMLFAIGAGDAVVGVSSFDHYPAAVASRTRVGGLIDPDVERILSLKPDLVVVYGTQGDLIERLMRAHVPLFNYVHAGLPDITSTIRSLGSRVGAADQANRVAASIEERIEAIRRTVAGRPKPKTAVIIGREEGALRAIFASGGIGFLHDVLDAAGGADAFADVTQQNLQVSTEMLIARAPEVILELHPTEHWTAEHLRRETAVWNALPSLPAVRTHRVVILANDMLVVPGPRVADSIHTIAMALHPDVVH